jgi:adenosylmethionine-8-amino-7-oxononanoate aminotransferase
MYEGCLRLQAKYDLVGDVRGGHGLMTALELVSNRETKAPPAKPVPLALQAAAYENGAMVRVSGANVILSPALVISESEVETILSALDKGFAEASKI